MKVTTLYARWSAWRLLAACLISAGLMTGCGVGFGVDGPSGTVSSAGVGTGGTGTTGTTGTIAASVASVFKASLTSAATNDYLVNAIVFLDKNNNYQLDSGEPFAVTDVTGACELVVDPADAGVYPVVAVALKGVTIENATKRPIASNYILSFPKESFNSTTSNIISPLSSQLRELLETGKYATTQQAMGALASQMGLPSDINLLAENIAAGNPTLGAAAKSIAALMWMQTDQIMVAGSTTPTVDVERYRTMMTLIENNMNIVSQLNTPENLVNLNSNIAVVLTAMPLSQPVMQSLQNASAAAGTKQ